MPTSVPNIDSDRTGEKTLYYYRDRNVTDEYLGVIYKKARLDAIAETGLEMPDTCPYALSDVISRSLTMS